MQLLAVNRDVTKQGFFREYCVSNYFAYICLILLALFGTKLHFFRVTLKSHLARYK